MSDEERFKLHCYVCGQGCVQWVNNLGWSTYAQIFVGRPDPCRYAVAEGHPPRIVVWDLFATAFDKQLKPYPPPAKVYASVDQAVMATQLRYDIEDEETNDG